MRNRLTFLFSLLLVGALSFTTLVYAQQSASPNLPPNVTPDRSAASIIRRERRRTTAPAGIERDLSEALAVIQDNYVDGKNLDYNAVFKSSINGMLHVLDPHSNYFDPKEFEEFLTEQRSEYFGIGAVIGDLRQGDQVNTYIRSTFEDSPASRAGLRYGDRILEVNGQSMRGKTYPEVREHLLGPRGSVAKVTVEHAATGRVETVEITRDAVAQPSIPEAYMIKPGVGYIAMTGGFNITTADEFRRALDDLHAQGMKMLILDLRGNRGGLLIQAVRVANTFLQRGQLILTQKGRIRGSNETYSAENDAPDTTPLVVLVNRGTASASEIVAGALQDHDRALIVGEPSFGKGLVQNPFMLEYGSALMLTIAKYYTPSGRLIQRDYTNGSLYDYYTHGGSIGFEKQSPQAPVGPASRTDLGRTVYGGGGILPDEIVKPALIGPAEQRLIDPIFAFAVKLASGHLQGFDAYRVDHPIEYGHLLKATDFPITNDLYKAFKSFVASNPVYRISGAQLDRQRPFVERQLRYELATAAYGTVAATQVFNAADPQIARGIDLLPRARDLAQMARRAHATS